ncbi:MAG: formate/nitrite transporter family protein [Bacteroidales bacterium]
MNLYTPPQILDEAGKLAIEKDKYSTKKILTLAFLAGVYISFGGMLALLMGGGVPGIAENNPAISKFLLGAAFPVGLMLVVLAGGELFTGNNAYFMPNVLSGKQKLAVPLRNWALVYIGNFIGCIFTAYVLTHLTQVIGSEPWSDYIEKIAVSKTSNPFYKTLLKGIGANWLVCLALWMGMSAKSTAGKILGIWWPVMTFVTLGFEHCVANMYFIPLAIFEGSDISWIAFIVDNLIPATIGNIIGGAFFVGTLYWYAYKKDEKIN